MEIRFTLEPTDPYNIDTFEWELYAEIPRLERINKKAVSSFDHFKIADVVSLDGGNTFEFRVKKCDPLTGDVTRIPPNTVECYQRMLETFMARVYGVNLLKEEKDYSLDTTPGKAPYDKGKLLTKARKKYIYI